MKKCSKCGQEKKLKEFYRDSRLSSGFRSSCKVCCEQVKHGRPVNVGFAIREVDPVTAPHRGGLYSPQEMDEWEKSHQRPKASQAPSRTRANRVQILAEDDSEPITTSDGQIKAFSSILNLLRARHDCHFSVSMGRTGEIRFQFHGHEEDKHYYGTDVENLLQRVLA